MKTHFYRPNFLSPEAGFSGMLYFPSGIHFSIESAAYNLIYHLILNSLFAGDVYFWHHCTELATINVTCDRYYWLSDRWHLWPTE